MEHTPFLLVLSHARTHMLCLDSDLLFGLVSKQCLQMNVYNFLVAWRACALLALKFALFDCFLWIRTGDLCVCAAGLFHCLYKFEMELA